MEEAQVRHKMKMECYTGGGWETNAYVIQPEEGGKVICFDAPEGIVPWLQARSYEVDVLVLTHGHFDHIWEAALLEREHQCRLLLHPEDGFMVQDRSLFRLFGLGDEVEPIEKFESIELPHEGVGTLELRGIEWTMFHIPGHSPGSLAFYQPEAGWVIAGDTLFAGAIGRWDLPGGSRETLVRGIQRHLLPLPGKTEIYPGHGPATTVEQEKRRNRMLTLEGE